MREMVINEPLPDLIVRSTRRTLIGLNLPDYEARSLADTISESRSYLESNSDGGWGSDPQILIRLEQAVRSELLSLARELRLPVREHSWPMAPGPPTQTTPLATWTEIRGKREPPFRPWGWLGPSQFPECVIEEPRRLPPHPCRFPDCEPGCF